MMSLEALSFNSEALLAVSATFIVYWWSSDGFSLYCRPDILVARTIIDLDLTLEHRREVSSYLVLPPVSPKFCSRWRLYGWRMLCSTTDLRDGRYVVIWVHATCALKLAGAIRLIFLWSRAFVTFSLVWFEVPLNIDYGHKYKYNIAKRWKFVKKRCCFRDKWDISTDLTGLHLLPPHTRHQPQRQNTLDLQLEHRRHKSNRSLKSSCYTLIQWPKFRSHSGWSRITQAWQDGEDQCYNYFERPARPFALPKDWGISGRRNNQVLSSLTTRRVARARQTVSMTDVHTFPPYLNDEGSYCTCSYLQVTPWTIGVDPREGKCCLQAPPMSLDKLTGNLTQAVSTSYQGSEPVPVRQQGEKSRDIGNIYRL